MRSVEIEHVEYNTKEVAHVADVLVWNFIRYSQIDKVSAWGGYRRVLSERIRKQSPQRLKLTSRGIDLLFSGFDLTPHEDKTGKLVIEEPWFGAFKNEEFILPSERNNIHKATSAIFLELCRTYHMDIKSAGIISFPKELYARVWTVKAPLPYEPTPNSL